MKKIFSIFAFVALFSVPVSAQNYNNIVNYNFNGRPIYGVKIRTNLPFTPTTQMPTIIIEGYNYGMSEPIGLMLTYYTYFSGNTSNCYFHEPKISTFGSYTAVCLFILVP